MQALSTISFDAVAEHDVGGVVMGADKVERETVLLAEGDHIGDVRVVGSRGTAHAEEGIDLLHCLCGDAVELVVVLHIAAPEPAARKPVFAVEVGLVPHFEVPGAHFVAAVASDEVGDELLDEPYPAAGVVGRRDVRLVVEDGLVPAL